MKLVRRPARPTRSPILARAVRRPEFDSWKAFLDSAYWLVELKD